MRIERRPVLDRGRIVEREVMVTAEHPRGLWHVDGVPLAALKAYLDAAETRRLPVRLRRSTGRSRR